jgi:hypothetical protein
MTTKRPSPGEFLRILHQEKGCSRGNCECWSRHDGLPQKEGTCSACLCQGEVRNYDSRQEPHWLCSFCACHRHANVCHWLAEHNGIMPTDLELSPYKDRIEKLKVELFNGHT